MFQEVEAAKVVQAAGVLLRAHGGQMSYMRLLKLLYIADRESLKQHGRTIVRMRPVAMDNGPLHSEIYNLIKGEHPAEGLWSKHIQKSQYQIVLTSDPGVLELSAAEIRILNEVADKYGNTDDWELVNQTHEFPEWKNNHSPGSSKPIPLRDILNALNFSSDEIAGILDDLDEHAKHDALLNKPGNHEVTCN